jgi:dGTPase
MLDRFVGDLITNTQMRVKQAGIQIVDEARDYPERLAAFTPDVEEERKQAKDFLYESVYFSPSLASEKEDAERVVSDLFAFWMENSSALPHYYQEKAGEESLPRVICDYIAGMTDHFILEQHAKYCSGTG